MAVSVLSLIPLLVAESFLLLVFLDEMTLLLVLGVRVPGVPGGSFESQLLHARWLFFRLHVDDADVLTFSLLRYDERLLETGAR